MIRYTDPTYVLSDIDVDKYISIQFFQTRYEYRDLPFYDLYNWTGTHGLLGIIRAILQWKNQDVGFFDIPSINKTKYRRLSGGIVPNATVDMQQFALKAKYNQGSILKVWRDFYYIIRSLAQDTLTARLAFHRKLIAWILDAGYPNRRTRFLPEWRTTTVLGLAKGIYCEDAFDRMPILADALEEAGLEHQGLLASCRSGQSLFTRGNWLLNRILQKEMY